MFFFDKLVPIPLQSTILESDIWACTSSLDSAKKYFLEAPSGSGKTTFQHILYGLRNDYKGTVQLDYEGKSQNLTSLSIEDWSVIRQKKLSVVFQDLRLFAELSGLDNLELKNKLSQHKSKEAILEMCQRLDVADLLDKACGQMSYGQQQRIAIIRALCQPFQFLILDEPFSHLDSRNIRKCSQLIQEECQAQNAGLALLSLEDSYGLDYDVALKL